MKIKGIVTWVQQDWRSYQPQWSRTAKYYRKLYVYIQESQISIECVAWDQKYWTDVFTGQIVTIEGQEKTNKFNGNLQVSIRKMTPGDFYREFKTFTFTNFNFQYGFIKLYNDTPWIRGSVNADVSPMLQKYRNLLNENLTVTVEGMPKVVRFDNGKAISFVFDKDSNARITEHNWGPLEKAAMADEEAKKWREYLATLKVHLNKIIDLETAQKLAKDMGVECKEEDLLSVIFQPEYEREYFDHLKKKAKSIRYTKDSFLFETEDAIIWEKPKMGSATYIFKHQDINTLTARIDSLGLVRSAIRSNACNIATELQFKRIVIHRDFEQWSKDLEE